MRTFGTLVGYEYRKIFRRRATWAALALGLVFLVVTSQISLFGGYYLDGEFVETNRQRLSADRAFAAALSGRPLDDALFDTAAAAFAAIPADAPLYQATEEYNEIARPYEPVWETLGFFFSSEELRAETTGWGQAFYSQRKAWMAERIGAIQASEATRAALLRWDSQVKQPWTYRFTQGWSGFFTYLEMIGFLVMFLSAVLLAPLFAGEYARGTDPLLRTCRHGVGKLGTAKLATGLGVTLGLYALFGTATAAVMALTYGVEAGDAPLQLLQIGFAYPLTLGQAAAWGLVCVLGGCLLMTALLLLASAALRSAFPVVVGATVLLLVPMMFDLDPTSAPLWPLLALNLLPSRIMKFENIFCPAPYDFFGTVLPQYIVFPAAAILFSLPLAALAMRAYRRHQG